MSFCHSEAGAAPKFLEKPSIKQQGSLIVMSCVVESTPEPGVRWFRGEEEVKAGGRFNIRTEKYTTENSYRLICEIHVSVLDRQEKYRRIFAQKEK